MAYDFEDGHPLSAGVDRRWRRRLFYWCVIWPAAVVLVSLAIGLHMLGVEIDPNEKEP